MYFTVYTEMYFSGEFIQVFNIVLLYVNRSTQCIWKTPSYFQTHPFSYHISLGVEDFLLSAGADCHRIIRDL